MPDYDNILTHVEKATPHLTIAILQSTKIGKVMRKISTLPATSVPRDEEFKIRERAGKLVQSWQAIVEKHGKDGEDAEGEPEVPVDAAAEPEKVVNGEINGKIDASTTVTTMEAVAEPPTETAGEKMVVDEKVDEKVEATASKPEVKDADVVMDIEPPASADTVPATATA